jgi:hypothetical protein
MIFPRMLLALLLCGRAALLTAQSPQLTSPSNDEAIVSWIRQNAIPLRSVQAGTGFSDLEP